MTASRKGDIEVAYVPADPPRAGRIVFCGTAKALSGLEIGRAARTGIVADPEGTVRRRQTVAAGIGEGGRRLLGEASGTRSWEVWALAARKALELVARGLVVPGLDRNRNGAWRIAGLTGADDQWLHRLADAMPTAAYAAAGPGGALPDPYRLLRAFLDGFADSWLREHGDDAAPAAFTAPGPVDAEEFGWPAERLAKERDTGLGAALVLEAGGYAPRLVATWYDRREPARLVDGDEDGEKAPDLHWHFAHIGRMLKWKRLADAERRYWGDPLEYYIDADDIAFLFDRGGIEALAARDVEVRFPLPLARRFTGSITLAADADPNGAFSLDSRPALEWRITADGRELTEAELETLARSDGRLVKLDDRLLLLDRSQRRYLGARLDRPAPLAAIGAALTGTYRVHDVDVPFTAAGDVADMRDRLRAIGNGEPARQPAGLEGKLRDYQRRGLTWLDAVTRLGFGALLADDMGLGKTVTVIAFHLARRQDPERNGPALVVCPGTLLGNWAAELQRFAPGLPVRRFHGTKRRLDDLRPGEVVLTTYGTLTRDAAQLAAVPWGLVCADEAQAVKNPATAMSKALRGIKSGTRIALTGTPIENHLGDLWAILDWTTPGLLGSAKAFRETYGRPAEQGDAEAAARLGTLVRPFYLRRVKTDPEIATELPPKTVTDQHVALSPEQARLYRRVFDEEMGQVRGAEGIDRRGRVLAMLTRLKQVCNHPAHFHGVDDPAAGRSGKLDLLDELLDTITAERQQALVFTQYAAMARLLTAHLEARGTAVATLHGETTVQHRERTVAAFQDGRHRVLVLTVKTGGTGLNLTAAGHVVHYDRWWNPAVEDQASDRAHRIGQTQPVQIHRLICEGTLEERIAGLLERKRDLADAVIGAGEAALTELSDEQLLELIRLEQR
ncbi:SNF2-related protein [Glycomyces sp. NPDC047369]